MKMYLFHSRFRSANFEDIPGVSVRDFQVVTYDPEVAEKLRRKSGLWEVPTVDPEESTPAPALPEPPIPGAEEKPKADEELTDEERFQRRKPKVVRGAKKSTDTEGAPK